MQIKDSTITDGDNDNDRKPSDNPANNRYLFHVMTGSVFSLVDSEISECGYASESKNSQGLSIYADGVCIENTRFNNNYAGLIVYSHGK